MEDDAVLPHESIIQGNHGQKSSRSFRANRFDVDLSADVTALDLNLVGCPTENMKVCKSNPPQCFRVDLP